MKRLFRFVIAVVAILTTLAVPGTAFARTEPFRPESDATLFPSTAPLAAQSSASASSGWAPTTIVAIAVVVLLVAGIAIVAVRTARQRRLGQAATLGV